MKKKNGFTLLELMITIAIVGILTSIAMPGYRDYMRRSQITEATSTLSSMRVKLEQHYQDNRTYTGACGASGLAAKPSNLQNFDLSCNLGDDTYTLTATGKNGVKDFVFTIDQSNNKATTSVPSGWTANNACWIINKTGSCS